jgi:dihydrolipoamide dehydrogenase
MTENKKYKVVVIGGGPGGYAAAFMAADLGLEVALIDPEANPGGVCLYRGCIPSKALLHLVKLKKEAAEAAAWGLHFSEPEIDLGQIRKWKNQVVEKLTGGLGQLIKKRNITFIRGKAKFLDSQNIEVKTEKGKKEKISFEHAILATGSVPVALPDVAFGEHIFSSAEALSLPEIPKSLLVVGAGYIGLEIGTVYAGLGAEVSVVEMTSSYLPGVDSDLVEVFDKHNKDLFKAVKFETKVGQIKSTNEGVTVTFNEKNNGNEQASFEKVLIAIGRKPRTEGLGLENTSIKINDMGFITVNAQRQTDDKYIYAIGDITGEPMLAHKASHEGKVAAEAIAGKKTGYDPKAIPAVVFTDPEIAWCGLTEAEAKEKDIEIKIAKFPWSASGRAATLGRSDGLTKLITEAKTQHILGVGIAGKNAGDLIPEAALAVEMSALAIDLSLTIHPHPTLSETLMEAADALFGHSTHIYRPK